MARGRFLSGDQASNRKVSGLSDGAYRVWAMCYPHSDRDGRLSADVEELVAISFPMLVINGHWTTLQVRSYVLEIVDSGLWIDRGEYFEISGFKDDQKGLRYHREAASKWDDPRPDESADLASMRYADYLKTVHWATRRERAISHAAGKCQVCNETASLEVHHRTYERRGRELDEDLVVLCRKCHGTFHENGQLAVS